MKENKVAKSGRSSAIHIQIRSIFSSFLYLPSHHAGVVLRNFLFSQSTITPFSFIIYYIGYDKLLTNFVAFFGHSPKTKNPAN